MAQLAAARQVRNRDVGHAVGKHKRDAHGVGHVTNWLPRTLGGAPRAALVAPHALYVAGCRRERLIVQPTPRAKFVGPLPRQPEFIGIACVCVSCRRTDTPQRDACVHVAKGGVYVSWVIS